MLTHLNIGYPFTAHAMYKAQITRQQYTEGLSLDLLEACPDIHGRNEISDSTVYQFVNDIKNNSYEPVIVVYDGTRYWLADGFHRYQAAILLQIEQINCVVRSGIQRDAVLIAIYNNRNWFWTKADKRRAVTVLLSDQEWQNWSDREIARHCGCSHTYVGKLRGRLCPSQKDLNNQAFQNKTTRVASRNGHRYSMDVTKIGHTGE